jgi:hypothetical protein
VEMQGVPGSKRYLVKEAKSLVKIQGMSGIPGEGEELPVGYEGGVRGTW